jgi:hypothetical protein
MVLPTRKTDEEELQAAERGPLEARHENSRVVEKTPAPITPMTGKLAKQATMSSSPARGLAKHATTATANLAAKLLDDNDDADNSLVSPPLLNGKMRMVMTTMTTTTTTTKKKMMIVRKSHYW